MSVLVGCQSNQRATIPKEDILVHTAKLKVREKSTTRNSASNLGTEMVDEFFGFGGMASS
jgi:hypothetical protein